MLKVFSADRRGRGWETGWTRTKTRVKLTQEPEDASWQRLPEPVRQATLTYHKIIAEARAKAEHNADRNGMLYTPNPANTVIAERWRGDIDSLQHILATMLESDHDPTQGPTRATVQATTRTRMSYTRTHRGDVTITLIRPNGAGSVSVPAGRWLVLDHNDELNPMTDEEFHTQYQKATK